MTIALTPVTEGQEQVLRQFMSALEAGWFAQLTGGHDSFQCFEGHVTLERVRTNVDMRKLFYSQGSSRLEVIQYGQFFQIDFHHKQGEGRVFLQPTEVFTFESEETLAWAMKAIERILPLCAYSEEWIILEMLFAGFRETGQKAFPDSKSAFGFDGEHTVSYVGPNDGCGRRDIWFYVEHPDHFEIIGNIYGKEIRSTRVDPDGIYFTNEGVRGHRCDLINTKEMHPAKWAVNHFYRSF